MDMREASLIFLDAIEKGIRGETEAIKKLESAILNIQTASRTSSPEVVDAINALRAVMLEQKPPTVVMDGKGEFDGARVVEGLMGVANTVLVSSNKQISAIDRMVVEFGKLCDVVEKPRKYEIKIDRNHQTKLIQSVTIEQIKEN